MTEKRGKRQHTRKGNFVLDPIRDELWNGGNPMKGNLNGVVIRRAHVGNIYFMILCDHIPILLINVNILNLNSIN